MSVSENQSTTIKSPSYPNTPRSELAFTCIWIIQLFRDMACLFDIIDFDGPRWLILTISATTESKEDLDIRFYSAVHPNNITIGNRSEIVFKLFEDTLYPRRVSREAFAAKISFLPIAHKGKV